jgi:hypothetical protein
MTFGRALGRIQRHFADYNGLIDMADGMALKKTCETKSFCLTGRRIVPIRQRWRKA